jgi:DNA-binding NarL/FixJ family response regulator
VNPRAHALIVSASLEPAEIASALESGAAGTLDKNAQLDELVDAVRRLRLERPRERVQQPHDTRP